MKPSFISGRFPRLDAVRMEQAAIAIALALFLFGSLGIWLLLLQYLDRKEREVEESGLEEASLLAVTYAGQLNRTLEALDELALYVKQGWEATNGRINPVYNPIRKQPQATSNLFLSIIDENGSLRSSSIPQPKKNNVAHEPYFVVHRTPNNDFYIGNIRKGNFSETPIIPFTRRLSAADDAFRGIVLISVAPEYFTAQYEENVLGRHGFLGVFNLNGFAQSVRADGKTLDLDQTFIVRPLLFTRPSGSVQLSGTESFSDGRSRYVGWHTTDPYQMVAVAGVDRTAHLAPYLAERRRMLQGAMSGTVAYGAVTGVIVMLLHRLAKRRDQMQQMQRTYRLATESANEGFFIASPTFDRTRSIIDFTITDCNEGGANYLGFTKCELIGRTVSSLYAGETFSRTMRMLKRAMRDRQYEAEFDLSLLGMTRPRWVHWKIMRADDDLAINMRDISTIKEQVAKLEKLTMEDSLTGLPNRYWANHSLPEAITTAMQGNHMLALLYIDLDGFKSVNDSAGHAIGDEVLQHTANRLREAVRPHDQLARLGGDEFIVVLHSIGGIDDCSSVAQRILHAFSPPLKTSAGTYQIGTSIGIAVAPDDGTTVEVLLKHADAAMYVAKEAGKHRYAFFRRST